MKKTLLLSCLFTFLNANTIIGDCVLDKSESYCMFYNQNEYRINCEVETISIDNYKKEIVETNKIDI